MPVVDNAAALPDNILLRDFKPLTSITINLQCWSSQGAARAKPHGTGISWWLDGAQLVTPGTSLKEQRRFAGHGPDNDNIANSSFARCLSGWQFRSWANDNFSILNCERIPISFAEQPARSDFTMNSSPEVR
jgi:hypothetical protein